MTYVGWILNGPDLLLDCAWLSDLDKVFEYFFEYLSQTVCPKTVFRCVHNLGIFVWVWHWDGIDLVFYLELSLCLDHIVEPLDPFDLRWVDPRRLWPCTVLRSDIHYDLIIDQYGWGHDNIRAHRLYPLVLPTDMFDALWLIREDMNAETDLLRNLSPSLF